MPGSERDELVDIVLCYDNHPVATADAILAAGYRRVVADEDTVERVAKAIENADPCSCQCKEAEARAAINALGGRDG